MPNMQQKSCTPITHANPVYEVISPNPEDNQHIVNAMDQHYDNGGLRLRNRQSFNGNISRDMGSADGSEDDLNDQRSWARQNPEDMTKLMESLPSRQLEQVFGNKQSAKAWKNQSLHTVRFKKNSEFVNTLAQSLSADLARDADTVDMDAEASTILRDMTAPSLSAKLQIKRQLSSKAKNKSVGWFAMLKSNITMTFRHFKQIVANLFYYLDLWKGQIKKIEGHFGTGVTSYFKFLRWLFLINIPIFLLSFAFIIVPQILYKHFDENYTDPAHGKNITFHGQELITGEGWFTHTELYYGYYTNKTILLVSDHQYTMQYSYLFTCGGYYLLCLIILAYSMSKSYRKNYIETGSDVRFLLTCKLFCHWDYGITSKDAADLENKSFYNQLLEYLADNAKVKKKFTCCEWIKWILIRLAFNLLVIALIAGAGYLIYYLAISESVKTDIDFLNEMALPLCISAILVALPFGFTIIGTLESYEKPKVELYLTMLRTMTLKAVVLGVLIYYWFNKLPCADQFDSGDGQRTEMDDRSSDCSRCWETLMGQQIYRLVLVDFIFILFVTFFVEFIRSLLHKHCCSKKLADPEFNIGRNTLSLIYSQTLCWLGTFYCPMLSFITLLKLFIIFYVKRVSVMQNCKPSLKPWRAARIHTIFLGFLFCFFLLASVTVTCSIIFIKPSPSCGPFRNQPTTYTAVIDLMKGWKETVEGLSDTIDFITSPGMIACLFLLLCMGCYYLRIVMLGHKEMVSLIKHQLDLEGQDRSYLCEKYQSLMETASTSMHSMNPSNSVVRSPAGKAFAKAVDVKKQKK